MELSTSLNFIPSFDLRRKKVQRRENQLKSINTHIHQDLIEQCKLGQRKAQFELYSLYVDAMYNVSFHMMHNREDAEDILQESFSNAFKAINRFDYQSTFGAWLKRIVVNNCINKLKKKKLPVDSYDGHEYKIKDDSNTTEKEEDYNIEKVKKGISLLPGGFRTVLNLYLLEGYDHAEIGEILNISSSTSKSQCSRAKVKLKEILKTI